MNTVSTSVFYLKDYLQQHKTPFEKNTFLVTRESWRYMIS